MHASSGAAPGAQRSGFACEGRQTSTIDPGDGEGRELDAFTAILADPGVTVDRAAAWMRRVELLRENSYVLASQRFSTPPSWPASRSLRRSTPMRR
jgi:hypothetical protein